MAGLLVAGDRASGATRHQHEPGRRRCRACGAAAAAEVAIAARVRAGGLCTLPMPGTRAQCWCRGGWGDVGERGGWLRQRLVTRAWVAGAGPAGVGWACVG